MKTTPYLRLFRPLARLLTAAGLIGGCALPDPDDLVLGPEFKPANYHVETRRLNPQLRRVLVLPLTSEAVGSPAADALESLETTVRAELKRTQRFELVWLTRSELVTLSGRSDWAADSVLPADFLKRLQEQHQCDGVLFCRLTRYETYPPLAVGWQFKLVGCPMPQVLWAFDEVFDAREAGVVNGARRFQQADKSPGRRTGDSRVILSSPRRFAAYAAHGAFLTLPDQ